MPTKGQRWSRRILAAACLAAALVVPAAASGAVTAPGPAKRSPVEEACPLAGGRRLASTCADEFAVTGSDGYQMTVSARPGDPEAEVTAESSTGSVEYLVPAKVTSTAIRARIGKVGRIDVHFVPSGRERRVPISKRCVKDQPPVAAARLGHFVGTIELHGERDYTKVVAKSAPGGIGDPPAIKGEKVECEYHEPRAQKKSELESAELVAKPTEGTTLATRRLFPGFPGLSPKHAQLLRKAPHFVFLAVVSETAGGISILRSASALGGSQTFLSDAAMTSATVSPPAPFIGSGAFLREADGSVSWTGSLAVQMPGLGTVPLTGGTAELASVAVQTKRLLEELEEKVSQIV